MSLIDANALVNMTDKNQPHRAEFRAAFSQLLPPRITTWPAFTEAMYLLRGIGGWGLGRKLWDWIDTGIIQFHCPEKAEIQRIAVLIELYRDRPMDLSDASLIAAAETRNDRKILTQDADFYIYRFQNSQVFEVLP